MPPSGRAGFAGSAVCAASLDRVDSSRSRERRRLRCRLQAVPALPARPSAPPAWNMRIRRGRLRIVVLTTSYPRSPGDAAGRFVADAVEHVRERGVDVEVVSPAQFRHYGLAYGSGVLGNLRREPWRAFLSPLMLASFRRAARRAARGAAPVPPP